jgi:hypothetical protein
MIIACHLGYRGFWLSVNGSHPSAAIAMIIDTTQP